MARFPNQFFGATNPSPGMFDLSRWADSLAPVTGDWIKSEAFAGVSWLQIVLSVAVLLGTVAIGQLLRWLFHCRIRTEVDAAPTPGEAGVSRGHDSWIKLILEAAIPPMTAFVWLRGIYTALWLIFAARQPGGDSSALVQTLNALVHIATIAAFFWFLFRMVDVVELRLKTWAAGTTKKWDDVMAAIVPRALRLATPLMGLILIIPTLNVPENYQAVFNRTASILLIGAIGFILYQIANAAEKSVIEQYRIDIKDNLSTRKVQTQVRVLKRLAVFLIAAISVASMLMVFEPVRQLGTSLLASAGVAGVVIGFAAQRSIATFVAGIQIAFTQPIRLDDVVVLEGEFGNVEEISLTYVVVRTWDSRRLVLPISYFIEKPFQNWTRVSADLLCTVVLYADYTVPIAPLRQELSRILDKSKFWDRRANVLQVTDAKERTIELRALASAANAGAAWNLRCEVREGLIDFLQRRYPQCLPRERTEITALPNGESKIRKQDAELERHILTTR